ncbi:hypothetical protein [Micromonospora sp. NPDC047730]|uniref:hypothetical protein n=1 Tax=Micromonospora sp. NPDC047730 TaxID=3364253 RepID=UPI00371CB77D
MKRKIDGLGWVYAGTALGLVASLGFNVGHAFARPEGAPADWSPSVGRILFGVFLPLATGILLEVVTRVAWPKGRAFVMLRFGGVGSVGLASGYVSFLHTSGLLAAWGEDRQTQVLGALAVDGLLLLCSCALVLLRHAATKAGEGAPATPRQTTADAPASLAPTWDTPPAAPVVPVPLWGPAPGVLVAACEAPEPVAVEEVEEIAAEPEPERVEETTPTDPRYVTALVFDELPAPRTPGRAAEIRRRFALLKEENPDRTQTIIADLIGVPRRNLRDALAAAQPEPTDPPRLQLVTS